VGAHPKIRLKQHAQMLPSERVKGSRRWSQPYAKPVRKALVGDRTQGGGLPREPEQKHETHLKKIVRKEDEKGKGGKEASIAKKSHRVIRGSDAKKAMY